MTGSFSVDVPVETKDNLDARSDLELVAAVNGGDATAFEALYLRHRHWVTNLACRFTRDHDLALDVLQETFLYFLRKFPGFRLTANLKTFLYPAVRNLSIAARRKAERAQSSAAELSAIDQAAAETTTSDAGDLAFVLAGLSEEHREVLLLRFIDGLSLAEIADAMDIPLGTAKSRLHHALNLLRQDPRTKAFFDR